MDCEEELVAQAAMTKALNPRTRVFGYRKCVAGRGGPWRGRMMRIRTAMLCSSSSFLSSPPPSLPCARSLVKALPWFSTVREKLVDPAYAGFFLKFAPNATYHVPACDNNFSPPLCSVFCEWWLAGGA